MSEEEPGVTVGGCDHFRSGYNVADKLLLSTEFLRFSHCEDVEEICAGWDATFLIHGLGEISSIVIGNAADIVWKQAHHEWPLGLVLTVAVGIVVSESFDTHMSNVVGGLGKFGVRSLETAVISRDIDHRVVVNVPSEEVEGVMAFERMHSKQVGRRDSISEHFEPSGSVWCVLSPGRADLRDTHNTVFSSFENSSEIMIVQTHKFELCDASGCMNNL